LFLGCFEDNDNISNELKIARENIKKKTAEVKKLLLLLISKNNYFKKKYEKLEMKT
jgi:hypothetical protein